MSTVFIGNLPRGVSEAEIFDLMAAAGHVAEIRWPVDRETGRRGDVYCFCDYVDAHAGAIALERLNGAQLRDKRVRVGAPTRDEQPPSDWRVTPARPAQRLTDFMPPPLGRV